jgi:hypothetical protein
MLMFPVQKGFRLTVSSSTKELLLHTCKASGLLAFPRASNQCSLPVKIYREYLLHSRCCRFNGHWKRQIVPDLNQLAFQWRRQLFAASDDFITDVTVLSIGNGQGDMEQGNLA